MGAYNEVEDMGVARENQRENQKNIRHLTICDLHSSSLLFGCRISSVILGFGCSRVLVDCSIPDYQGQKEA